MLGNDIGVDLRGRVAVWFEELLVSIEPAPEMPAPPKKRWWHKVVPPQEEEALSPDLYTQSLVRRWRVNEMPLKSVIHMQNQLALAVDVYTYYDFSLKEEIEHYLARKGVHVTVYPYENLEHLIDDLKYNREVHTLYTAKEEDALTIGLHRATVVSPLGTLGI